MGLLDEGGEGYEPALEAEDEEEGDVIDDHCTESDFGDELVLLGDKDAEVEDEDRYFGERRSREVEDHACPADLSTRNAILRREIPHMYIKPIIMYREYNARRQAQPNNLYLVSLHAT